MTLEVYFLFEYNIIIKNHNFTDLYTGYSKISTIIILMKAIDPDFKEAK